MNRIYSFPPEAKHFFLFDHDSKIKAHHDYEANFIQSKGGKVAGSIVMVNAGRNKSFNPVKKHINILKERFNEQILQKFGIEIKALTANEAGYLVGFKTFEEIRNRFIKAKKTTDLRLLSKGIS